MTLQQLNQASLAVAKQSLMSCCSATRWVELMTAARPFESMASLQEIADNIWLRLNEQDFLEAFEGHPKIGDINSLRAKYALTKSLASGEQASVEEASEAVLRELSLLNQAYLERFGFIFIVCASGKSALEMLDLLKARIHNQRNQELKNAAAEQRQIFQLRIKKLLEN